MRTHSPKSASGPDGAAAPELRHADWLAELRARPAAVELFRQFAVSGRQLAEEVLRICRVEVPELGATSNPIVLERVLAHIEMHTEAISSLPAKSYDVEQIDVEFVRSNASLRAREDYPLSALLHSYRIGHRVIWEQLSGLAVTVGLAHEAWRMIAALSALTMDYTNRISISAADAYTEERRYMEELAGRARRDVLDVLLSGSVDAMTLASAHAFGLNFDSQCVAFAAKLANEEVESVAVELFHSEESLQELLRVEGRRLLVAVRGREIVGVVPARRNDGRELAQRLRDLSSKWMRSRAFLVGVSSPCEGLDNVAQAYRDAHHAQLHATSDRPVIAFADIPVFDHLVATADPAAYRIRPPWMDELLDEDRRSNGDLLTTLRAHLESNLSAKATAARLGVHTNTVYYRLKKIERLTSQNTGRVADLLNLIAIASLHPRSPPD